MDCSWYFKPDEGAITIQRMHRWKKMPAKSIKMHKNANFLYFQKNFRSIFNTNTCFAYSHCTIVGNHSFQATFKIFRTEQKTGSTILNKFSKLSGSIASGRFLNILLNFKKKMEKIQVKNISYHLKKKVIIRSHKKLFVPRKKILRPQRWNSSVGNGVAVSWKRNSLS